jgi:predicted  nucleic acid-binding Zn-ribbon protein
MKKILIIIGIFLVIGCATPAPVKQAIIKQSDAYGELQLALGEFKKEYISLNDQLFSLNQQSWARIEVLATISGLTGYDIKDLPEGTWARENYKQVNDLAKNLDEISENRSEFLDRVDRAAGYLRDSLVHGQKKSEKDIESIRKTLIDVENSQRNLLKEINSLVVIHDTVGEYLAIDLTPDAKTLKEAITNIKAIKK